MKICITGGGTGGHLMIAEALVEAAVASGHEAIFIGSKNGQDRKYFEARSAFSHVYFLESTGIVNKKGLGRIKAIYKAFLAFLQARTILKKHKIRVTYSVGGFSAAAAAFASLSRFMPLFMHEQNAVEGRLNKLLKPYATRFISAYDDNSPIKGYPVKEVFHQTARVRQSLKTIIFLGGSHGAKAINDLALSVALELNERGVNIIHQAGESDFSRVELEYEKLGIEVELYSFTKELPRLISISDLAISRAGASTLWELTANGAPAFYIPYPFAAGDHQFFNTAFIVDNDMGWCEREGEELKSNFLKILDEPLRLRSEKLLKYANKDVAMKMIQNMQEVINA